MPYYETHAHPDHELVESQTEYVSKMREAGIVRMVVAPITYESNYTSMELFPAKEYPEVLFAKGLHPKCATNTALWNRERKEEFRKLLSDPRVVALKSGIDLCKKKLQPNQIQRQFEFLQMFMDMAEEVKLPLVLHIREAAETTLSYLMEHPLKSEAAIHCFVYDKDLMQQFIDAGVHYFGIGGMITRSENDALREAVKEMPLSMILLESDAPFVRIEGETAGLNSSDIALPATAKKIAELKGVSVEEVIQATYENACRFFGK